MPGFARVAGEFEGRVTFVAVDRGPLAGLGNHDDGLRQLRRTGTTYPAAYAVDRSGAHAVRGAAHSDQRLLDRGGRVVKKVPSAFGESELRQEVAALAAS